MHILNVLETKKDYDEYINYVNTTLLHPHEQLILEVLNDWYEAYPTHLEVDDWKSFKTYILYGSGKSISTSDAHKIEALCESLATPSTMVHKSDIIDQFYTRKYATKIAGTALSIAEGDTTESIDDLFNEVDEWKTARSSLQEKDGDGANSILIDDDYVNDMLVVPAGEPWKLEALNECVGPLSNALFVVGARPDVGKTTFILEQGIHFAEKFFDNGSKKKITFFGNEESVKGRIIPRVACMSTGHDPAMLKNPTTRATVMRDFKAWMDKYEHPFKFYNSDAFTPDEIEHFAVANDSGFIIIDQLSKVNGYEGKGTDVDRFAKVVKHIRRIAAEVAPVFGTVWADWTAEGEAYPNMAQLYGSKTALQGEADVILTLGKIHTGNTPTRYLSCVKNKVPYGDPLKSNGRWELHFDSIHGRWK